MKLGRIIAFAAIVGAMSTLNFSAFTQDQDEQSVDADSIVAAVQKICPISGNELGENPVKVQIGEEQVFVCCEGCIEGDDVSVDEEHWATIHANFAKAQGVCPVMEHDIPDDAKWTIVEGRIFYVCCPPCTAKIEEKPEEFTEKLLALYQASLEDEE